MPLKSSITNVIKKNSLRAFKMISRGKGVALCKFYNVTKSQDFPITISVSQNTGIQRTSQIKFLSYTGAILFTRTIVQVASGGEVLPDTETTLYFSSSIGSKTITLSFSDEWSVSLNNINWLTVSPMIGNTYQVERNIYHDVVSDTGPSKLTATDSYVYIDQQAPLQRVKELGWYREGYNLPLLAYFPVMEGVKPEKDALFVVADNEGLIAGSYKIADVKYYGLDIELLWVCNVVPLRDSNINFG